MEITSKELKLDDDICWMCGEQFDDNNIDKKKTFHHAIPIRYKPCKNVKVPLCNKCHHKHNHEDNIYKRYYYALKIFFDKTNEKLEKTKNRKTKKS